MRRCIQISREAPLPSGGVKLAEEVTHLLMFPSDRVGANSDRGLTVVIESE